MELKGNPALLRELAELDVRVLAAHDCFLDSNWKSDYARAPFNRIYFVYEGQGKVVSSGEEFLLKSGNIYLFPADTDFSYSCDEKLSKLYFHVNVFKWNRCDLLSGTKGIIFENMWEQIEKVRSLWENGDTLSALEIKSIIVGLVCRAVQENGVCHRTVAETSPLVKNVVELIEKEMRCTLNAAYLSEKLFVSESWLQRVFKEEEGVTLGKYINDRVLFTAQELLRYSSMSVKEVSEKLGYCDQFYFSKVFKARFGLSPLKYRKNVYI